MASRSLHADTVIFSDFGGSAGTGPAFQLLQNEAMSGSTFDASTGVVNVVGAVLGNGQASTTPPDSTAFHWLI